MDAEDTASLAPSNIGSTVSIFNGGTREIDVFLRTTRAAIDANMTQWYEKRKSLGDTNQAAIQATKDENIIQAPKIWIC